MTLTADEVLDAAKALPSEERAVVVQELIATLGDPDSFASSQHAALYAAVQSGIADLDEGRFDAVPADELRDYVRAIGREAAGSIESRQG